MCSLVRVGHVSERVCVPGVRGFVRPTMKPFSPGGGLGLMDRQTRYVFDLLNQSLGLFIVADV